MAVKKAIPKTFTLIANFPACNRVQLAVLPQNVIPIALALLFCVISPLASPSACSAPLKSPEAAAATAVALASSVWEAVKSS